MERRRVSIDNIYIGSRHREPDTTKVKEIAKSISEVGLMNPPAVVFRDGIIVDGEELENVPVLIYGRHRLLALQELGEVSVECIVHDVDDDYATIMEADENLARSEIQGAERTLSVKLREAAWNRIRAREEKSIVQNLDDTKKTSRRGRKGEGRPVEFATDTASASGMSRSAIYQELKRAEEIGEDNLKKIVGTPLAKGVEMDALIKLQPDERKELIDRASRGEKVSARPASSPKPTPTPKADKALSVVEALETIATGIVDASDNHDAPAPASLADFKRLWARMEKADQEEALVWARQNIKDDFDPAKLWLARA